ncbi:MAG TPA: nitrilase-related carbon-nitrogen hydrolase, partial [Acidobacteriota bacterium]|nr:nitrilase-related carbon-nitrogen hydrolase [Acidobacteriota bacterium]
MKIALAQINTTVGDIRGNSERIMRAIDKSRRENADIAVFPELCLTGYPPRDLLDIRGFVDANIAAIEAIAARTDHMGVVAGFVDINRSGKGRDFRNAAAFMAEGKIRQVVYKSLLPSYDVFDETRYFEKAGQVSPVRFNNRTLGISICEDAWNSEEFRKKPLYPSDPIREQVEKGADLLINIAASPYEMGKPSLRFRMLRDHAVRHRVPMVYVNLVGGNDDLL